MLPAGGITFFVGRSGLSLQAFDTPAPSSAMQVSGWIRKPRIQLKLPARMMK
jgi:hypothetical protein